MAEAEGEKGYLQQRNLMTVLFLKHPQAVAGFDLIKLL